MLLLNNSKFSCINSNTVKVQEETSGNALEEHKRREKIIRKFFDELRFIINR